MNWNPHGYLKANTNLTRMPLFNTDTGRMMPFSYASSNKARGLQDLTDDEVKQIITEHFKALPAQTITQIGLEAVSGKFDTLTNEVRVLMTKVCQAGALDKLGGLTNVLIPAGILTGVGLIYLIARRKK